MVFVKSVLDKYLEITDKFNNVEKETLTTITKSVVVVNKDQDLKNWIDSNRTGIESKEILIEYVPYVQKYGGDLNAVQKPKNSLFSKLGFGKKKKPSTKEEKPKSTPTSSTSTGSSPNPTSTSSTNVTTSSSNNTGSSGNVNSNPENNKPVTSPKEKKEDVKKDSSNLEPNSDVEVVDVVKKAKALFDFNKTEDNELSFKIGDIVNVTRVDER